MPEGHLLSRYDISVLVSADFLKTMEVLAWKCGMDRRQFNQCIFSKGLDQLLFEVEIIADPEHGKKLDEIARLGARAGAKHDSPNHLP